MICTSEADLSALLVALLSSNLYFSDVSLSVMLAKVIAFGSEKFHIYGLNIHNLTEN